jgi:hypothetical protein
MLISNAGEKNQNMKSCKNHGKTATCLFFIFSTMRKKLKTRSALNCQRLGTSLQQFT